MPRTSFGIDLPAEQTAGKRILLCFADLNQWKLDQKISFALGRIEKDLAKVRQLWGVRSLPWLVLTDEKHVVVAEGFGVDELDDRIGKRVGGN